MYALLFLDTRSAATLVALKALFALLTRGVTAGALSGCGGALSLLVLWALLRAPFPVSGYLFCVCGALAHNLGQLAGAAAILSSAMALGYAPVLLVAGDHSRCAEQPAGGRCIRRAARRHDAVREQARSF